MSNRKIPFLNLTAQNREIRPSLMAAFGAVLDSGVYVSGPNVAHFEESFSTSIGTSHAVACNTGTSALILALQAGGINPGDEVLVPGMTFIATIEAVVAVGGVPVIVDVDSNNWNLNVILAATKVSSRTKAMIFVHLHGNPAGIMDARKFCDENQLLLIEDAAQAHLASIDQKMVGSIGDVAAFSFYPGKNLGAIGEGGCLTTNSLDIYNKAKLIRNWGSKQKYVHEIRGTNLRMDEIQGAFLNIKLAELPRWTKHRRDLSLIYNELFDSMGVRRPFTSDNVTHSFHIYAIVVKNRDALRNYLTERSIETGIHYPDPIVKMEPWMEFFSSVEATPMCEELSRGFLSLPLSDQHSIEDIKYVGNVIKEFMMLNKVP